MQLNVSLNTLHDHHQEQVPYEARVKQIIIMIMTMLWLY